MDENTINKIFNLLCYFFLIFSFLGYFTNIKDPPVTLLQLVLIENHEKNHPKKKIILINYMKLGVGTELNSVYVLLEILS